MAVGKVVCRKDAWDKVTGRALYTDDICPPQALVAKLVHSTIANGVVCGFDLRDAESIDGVVKIFTCFDVPNNYFASAGHPWSMDPGKRDIADRKLLDSRVRIYGDDIAVVVATDEIAAKRAAAAIKVEYTEYPPVLTYEDALHSGAIQEDFPDNILRHTDYSDGDLDAVRADDSLIYCGGEYHTQQVQHCHIEPSVAYAYMESGRIVVVSSTQIPHITRRVVAQALGVPWGQVRIIKPYLGGGFGNKQDVLYEPLVAFLTQQLGGRCVKLESTREEVFNNTRSRHPMDFSLESWVTPEGRLVGRSIKAVSNQGGYASHGHAIVGNAIATVRALYSQEKAIFEEATTFYSNICSPGAMRGYGIPQVIFASEAHMDDIAYKLGMDPVELRLRNMIKEGDVDPVTNIPCRVSGLPQCIEVGKNYIGWDEKRELYRHQDGDVRRGVGMGIFCYKSGTYPTNTEVANCRMVLNQDGTIQMQMGATELGQGADTVFSQMAAETIGISYDDVHIVSMQDTDITPFDTGAYASRQSYVGGGAVKKAGEMLKARILKYAAWMLELPADVLDIKDSQIVEKDSGEILISLAAVAIESFYSYDHHDHITAEASHQHKGNTWSLGCSFVELEVDIPVGKITILNAINVHDCGRLLHPVLAQAQVHGGMSMSLGYALSEEMLYDDKARLLNGNLLDYKLPTSMDMPHLEARFVETCDPSGPYNNKSLGEPPAISPAPAVRNALLHATGVAVNSLPLNPKKLVSIFTEAGLITAKGGVR